MSIECKVRGYLKENLMDLFRFIKWLRPRSSRFDYDSEIQAAYPDVQERLSDLKTGNRITLPYVQLDARDYGKARTLLQFKSRIPPLPALIENPLISRLTRAFQKKSRAILFHGKPQPAEETEITESLLQCVICIGLKGPHGLPRPFLPLTDEQSNFAFRIHLTQRVIPFQENALHFELMQEARLPTRRETSAGYAIVPGREQTLILPGSGGNIKRDMRVELCDEHLGASAAFQVLKGKLFGYGDRRPWFFSGQQNRLYLDTNLEAIASRLEIELPLNLLGRIEIRPVAALLDFIQAYYGLTLLPEESWWVPVMKINTISTKTLPGNELVF